ncbi:MAG TPA: isoprenylcysteine carboxylmethyltransferase family protein [Stellaceae bacterium]|nr:isoprenylcysteine carboxylmethyltransferase family protein [Stellaceae bacterium]
MTYGLETVPSDPRRLRAILAGPMRDWAPRLCAVAAFGFLAMATMVRTLAILALATDGIDLLTAARLFATLCQTVCYLLVIVLTVTRRAPVKRAPGLEPRFSALAGTFLILGFGFLPPPRGLAVAWHVAAASLLLLGFALIFVVLLQLGRSFSVMAEARRHVTRGPYGVIRHPLYLAELICVGGAFIETASVPAAILVFVVIAFQIRRIYNEEAVLEAAFPDYAAYQASTARLIPGVW